VMTNGVAVMVEVPQLDAKGQPVMTNMPVIVDQKVEEQAIVQGPMASQVAIKMLGTNGAGTRTRMQRIHSKTRRRSLIFCRSFRFFPLGAG